MNLPNPITFTPPSFTRKDGTIRSFNSITLNELDITLIDNSKRKNVIAKFFGIPKALVLWKDQEYTNIGDYTQVQAEARILELLGNDPSKVITDLFRN
jgi:hypothetical protein